MPKLTKEVRRKLAAKPPSINPYEELFSFLRDSVKGLKENRLTFRYKSVKSGKLIKAVGKKYAEHFAIHENKARKGWQITHLPTRQSIVPPLNTEEQAMRFVSAIMVLEGWESKSSKELRRYEGCCLNLRMFVSGHSMALGAVELVLNRLTKGC